MDVYFKPVFDKIDLIFLYLIQKLITIGTQVLDFSLMFILVFSRVIFISKYFGSYCAIYRHILYTYKNVLLFYFFIDMYMIHFFVNKKLYNLIQGSSKTVPAVIYES